MLFHRSYSHEVGLNCNSKSCPGRVILHFPPTLFRTHSYSMNHEQSWEQWVQRDWIGAILPRMLAALWYQHITKASAGPCSKTSGVPSWTQSGPFVTRGELFEWAWPPCGGVCVWQRRNLGTPGCELTITGEIMFYPPPDPIAITLTRKSYLVCDHCPESGPKWSGIQ